MITGALRVCPRCRRRFHEDSGLIEPMECHIQHVHDDGVFCRGCRRLLKNLDPFFGDSSLRQLSSVSLELQLLAFNVIESGFDCSILCGHRSKPEQDDAFKSGRSLTEWPKSKHNPLPSKAMDIAPYPFEWPSASMSRQDFALAMGRFYFFGGYVRRIADEMGLRIRQGMDWNGNLDIRDQSFFDLPHIEIQEV